MFRRPLSRNLDSPVQTQMAVSVLSHPFGTTADFRSSGNKVEAKPAGRRRVFVQTDTGCVLGLDLDRSDNAHTVKRKLQLALHVPTDESSLTFGDMVLKNDLSQVCNDAPLLLKRNMMHRSSSTPCLSPTGKDIHPQPRDRSGLVEIIGCSTYCSQTRQLVNDVIKAINSGVDPVAVHSGLGGAYYFRNSSGESVAIVKPTDEEPFAPNNPKGFVGKALGQPGLKRSVRVGETGFREVAAYLLDYDHFANVPPTILVKITHSVFNVNDVNGCGNSKSPEKPRKAVSKIASFQQFIRHDFDASDYGTSSFPVTAVHRIGILDIRIFNTDRHGGNLLVRKVGGDGFGGLMELIPIDHGLCLPEALEDPYFEWIHWPQASIPFSEEELEYIANLDPVKDSGMLRRELPMIREACLRVLVVCTIFLKEAAGFGLCLAEIGEMMSREFKGVEEEPSELEVVCMEARRFVEEREASPRLSDIQIGEEEEFLFDIDCDDDDDLYSHRLSPNSHFGFRSGSSGRNPLSKLEESVEEEEEDDDAVQHIGDSDGSSILSLGHAARAQALLPLPTSSPLAVVSKLSVSLNSVGLNDKCQQKFQTKAGGSLMGENCLNNNIIISSSTSTSSTSSINSTSSFSINSNSNTNSSWGLQGRSGRSANEQLPGSASFVKLADMGEDEWAAFLEKFQELLPAAFRDRKCTSAGYRQRQRLGTSCQF